MMSCLLSLILLFLFPECLADYFLPTGMIVSGFSSMISA
jgi:hypothetical protein